MTYSYEFDIGIERKASFIYSSSVCVCVFFISFFSFGIVGGTQANFRLFDCAAQDFARGEKKRRCTMFSYFLPVSAIARTHTHTDILYSIHTHAVFESLSPAVSYSVLSRT